MAVVYNAYGIDKSFREAGGIEAIKSLLGKRRRSDWLEEELTSNTKRRLFTGGKDSDGTVSEEEEETKGPVARVSPNTAA